MKKALHSCFATFDDDNTGKLTLDQLHDSLDALGLFPTEEVLTGLLAQYAEEDADGEFTVTEDRFMKLMQSYIEKCKHARLDYEGKVFCPLNTFGLDFDFIPWGTRKTIFGGNKIDVSSTEGFCGMPGASDISNTSLETEKSRWLHMEGNPAPTWKLNAYLAESLVIYTLLSSWNFVADNTDSDALTWSLAI
eukprot:SAG11_NODE_10987_length_791_cov_1.076590_1_plen_191_part_01